MSARTAVVTGGTAGIGRAISESFLSSGINVFVCARTKRVLKDSIREMSALGSVDGEVCDVRSEIQVKMLLEECVRVFGGIDILVNNAGIGLFGTSIEEMDPADFRRIMETNLFGVFYGCHYVIPHMKERGGGYIFNISSLAGQNPHPGMAAYNASKFGLNGFSEALMQEVRHDDIKVSYICPGSVNTSFGGDEISDAKRWQLQPDDVAKTVCDLLRFPANALPSKVEIRPSKPPAK